MKRRGRGTSASSTVCETAKVLSGRVNKRRAFMEGGGSEEVVLVLSKELSWSKLSSQPSSVDVMVRARSFCADLLRWREGIAP